MHIYLDTFAVHSWTGQRHDHWGCHWDGSWDCFFPFVKPPAWWWLVLTLDMFDNIAVCETAVRLHGRNGSKPAGQSVSSADALNVTINWGLIRNTREYKRVFWTTLTTWNLPNCYFWTCSCSRHFMHRHPWCQKQVQEFARLLHTGSNKCRTQHFVKHSWQDPDQMFKFAVHWIEDPQWQDFWAGRLQARIAQQSKWICSPENVAMRSLTAPWSTAY